MMCLVVDKTIDPLSMLDVTRPVDIADQHDAAHLLRSQLRDSTIKRGHTISGVTAEAGAVFDHLLRRTHSDSSSSNSHRGPRTVSRRRLTVITETSNITDIGHNADESADNWTADITRDSIDTRLSSFDGLDEVDGKPSRSSVQSGYGFRQVSRDSTGTRMSSSDRLDDARLGSILSGRSFPQFSRNVASSAVSDRETVATMSVEGIDDVTDADDECKQKEKTPKKKKSVFQRVRERLRATFSRDEDRNRASRRADKYMHANGKASKQNWLTASFRRRRKKQQTDHTSENGSTSNHVRSSLNPIADPQSHYTIDRQSTHRDPPRSKGWLSSLQRRFSSVRAKRSQSHVSSMFF